MNNNDQLISALKVIAILTVLYLFLVSIGMIGVAFKGLGRNFAETLFQSEASPFIGLFIGILATYFASIGNLVSEYTSKIKMNVNIIVFVVKIVELMLGL